MRFLDESVAAKEEREREKRRHQQRAQNLLIMTITSVLIAVIAVGAVTWAVRARVASRRAEAKSKAILQVSRQTGETLAESRDLGVEETKRALEQAVDDFSDFVALRGSPRDLRELLAITNFNTANTSESRIAVSDRIAFYSEALKIQQELLHDVPEIELKLDLAFTLNKVGAVFLENERWEEAKESFRKAIALRQELVEGSSDDDPQYVKYNRLLASSVMNLGVLEARIDNPEGALSEYERADSIRRKFLASGDLRLLMEYADSQLNVALLHLKLVTKNNVLSQLDAANSRIRESKQISETLFNQARGSPDYQHLLAKIHLKSSSASAALSGIPRQSTRSLLLPVFLATRCANHRQSDHVSRRVHPRYEGSGAAE
jgi:tetratricopeptide (TPR) repeat protein